MLSFLTIPTCTQQMNDFKGKGQFMEQLFKDKVALVTGAAQGIGQATAEAFARAGALVVLSDVLDTRNQVNALVEAGFKATSIPCDVADEQAVEALINDIVSAYGRLDAAYNNAGINSPVAETADASSEEYDRVMNINLRGVWNCMKYELRQMRKQRHSGTGRLSRFQARRHRNDQKRCIGIRRPGNQHQCGLSRHCRNTDAESHDRARTCRSAGTDQ